MQSAEAVAYLAHKPTRCSKRPRPHPRTFNRHLAARPRSAVRDTRRQRGRGCSLVIPPPATVPSGERSVSTDTSSHDANERARHPGRPCGRGRRSKTGSFATVRRSDFLAGTTPPHRHDCKPKSRCVRLLRYHSRLRRADRPRRFPRRLLRHPRSGVIVQLSASCMRNENSRSSLCFSMRRPSRTSTAMSPVYQRVTQRRLRRARRLTSARDRTGGSSAHSSEEIALCPTTVRSAARLHRRQRAR